MFDYTDNRPLNLTQLGKLLGKHRSTILRWIMTGDRKSGIKLDYVQTPRGPETSLRAVWEFSERLKQRSGELPTPLPKNSRLREVDDEIRRGDWD